MRKYVEPSCPPSGWLQNIIFSSPLWWVANLLIWTFEHFLLSPDEGLISTLCRFRLLFGGNCSTRWVMLAARPLKRSLAGTQQNVGRLDREAGRSLVFDSGWMQRAFDAVPPQLGRGCQGLPCGLSTPAARLSFPPDSVILPEWRNWSAVYKTLINTSELIIRSMMIIAPRQPRLLCAAICLHWELEGAELLWMMELKTRRFKSRWKNSQGH